MIIVYIDDELKLYRGCDYVVSKYIVIHQPSIGEICDYGEHNYYKMVHHICATPQNFKWQLWENGIDYTDISPFDLFCNTIYRNYSIEETSILFGNLDFKKFELLNRVDDNSKILFQEVINENGELENVVIDEFTYSVIVDYLSMAHGIQRDFKVPANESTKLILIEDAKEEYERTLNKKYTSQLKNLISSMINCEGFKFSHTEVWNMKINAFIDSVKRISKMKNADLLLQSGYSGFGVNLKDIDNKQLDWLGEL